MYKEFLKCLTYRKMWVSQVALVVKNPLANAGGIRVSVSIPELGRSPGGGHGKPLQYSCLDNPMDRGAWWAAVHWIAKTWTRLKQLSMHTCIERIQLLTVMLQSELFHWVFICLSLQLGCKSCGDEDSSRCSVTSPRIWMHHLLKPHSLLIIVISYYREGNWGLGMCRFNITYLWCKTKG